MTPHRDELFDLGLQNERTALAWRRTALSLATTVVVIGRLTMGHIGFIAIILAGGCVAAAIGIGYLSTVRYRRANQSLTATEAPALRTDGLLPLLFCSATLALTGLTFVYVLL